jgi:hypothetical protein
MWFAAPASLTRPIPRPCESPSLSAKGAECNSPGQRPWVRSRTCLEALKARNGRSQTETSTTLQRQPSFRTFSAGKLRHVPPGPLAQAITFRALGAETCSFHTGSSCLLPAYCLLTVLRLHHSLVSNRRDCAAVFHLEQFR